jgi:branched-chain amino acid transport system substrate-binding protein
LYFYKAAVEKAKSTETDKVRTAMNDLSWQTPQGTKKMRAGDHQAMQDMFAVRVDNGEFNIVGRVPSDQAIGPDACTRF